MLESLFNKVAVLKACIFVKKRIQQSSFSGEITEFLRTTLFTEQLLWLLLYGGYKNLVNVSSTFIKMLNL